MRVTADGSDFLCVVEDIRATLRRLNTDGSLDGLIRRFEHMLPNLPPEFFETELVPAINAGDVVPSAPFHVIVRAGPSLNALAAALRALDFDVEKPHPVAPPSAPESISP